MKGHGRAYVELPHLVLDVALGEVLHVGELEVHLSQPDQDGLARAFKVLPLRGEVLGKHRDQGDNMLNMTFFRDTLVHSNHSVYFFLNGSINLNYINVNVFVLWCRGQWLV